jgi:hypothetical protein
MFSTRKKERLNTFLKNMKCIGKDLDQEKRHAKADALLCEILIAEGYKALVDAYEDLPKWFA